MSWCLGDLAIPITALHLIPGSPTLLLVGTGGNLEIYNCASGKSCGHIRAFDSDTVHGFCDLKHSTHAFDENLVLLWGGRSLIILSICHLPSKNLAGTPLQYDFVTSPIRAPDWILHAKTFPRDLSEEQEHKVAFITAHNEVFALTFRHGDDDASPLIYKIGAGPVSLLYSAKICLFQDESLTIVSGTITGQALVWHIPISQCSARHSPASHIAAQGQLQGHEGSVFGVDLAFDSAGIGFVVTCSDDRTIRLWQSSAGGIGDSCAPDEWKLLCSTIGHASRIWSVKIMKHRQFSVQIASAGEDGTIQIWEASCPPSDNKTWRIKHQETYAFHTGKNIWAWDILRMGDNCMKFFTGGADGRILSLSHHLSARSGLLETTIQQAEESYTRDLIRSKSESKWTITRQIFDYMIGHWSITRSLESQYSSQPSGHFTGRLANVQRAPSNSEYSAEFLYLEEGCFKSASGMEFKANRQYVYRYDHVNDQISAWFVKADRTTVDYLFHVLVFTTPRSDQPPMPMTAICSHPCVNDMYRSEYTFDLTVTDDRPGHWSLTHRVLGPSKDYTTRTIYTKDIQPSDLNASSNDNALSRQPDQPDIGHYIKTGSVDLTRRGENSNAFKAYAFASETELLATTTLGQILLAKVSLPTRSVESEEESGGQNFTLTWRLVAQIDDLRSFSMIASSPRHRYALLAGNSGQVFAFDLVSGSTVQLLDGRGKLGFLGIEGDDGGMNEGRVGFLLLRRLGAGSLLFEIFRQDKAITLQSAFDVEKCDSDDIDDEFVTTSFCVDKGAQTLFEGSRDGRIRTTQMVPKYSRRISYAHGANAVTSLKIIGYDHMQRIMILSAGRDGTYSIHRRSEVPSGSSDLQTISQIRLPLGQSIEGAYYELSNHSMIFWGFAGTAFKVWNEKTKQEIMSVNCKGAHRSWAYHFDPYTTISNYVWTQASKCRIAHQLGASHQILRSGSHGREIKTVAIRSTVSKYTSTTSEQISSPLLATGAEDTHIRIASLFDDASNHVILTDHTTGLQKLQWSSNGRWLFSAGGCEELFAWRVRSLPFGIAVLLEARCPRVTADGDLRVMDLDHVAHDFEDRNEEKYTVFAAYSDSSIRLWSLFKIPSDEKPNGSWKFELLSCFSHGAARCLTCLSLISPRHLMVASSDGFLNIWGIDATHKLNDCPTPQRFRLHQNSIKTMQVLAIPGSLMNSSEREVQSIDGMTTTGCEIIVLTGGDDQAVGISRLSLGSQNDSTSASEKVWQFSALLLPDVHASAVTGLVVISHRPSSLSFATVGTDQRIRTWYVDIDLRASGVEGFNVQSDMNMHTFVADASDMAACSLNQGSSRVLVAGIGTETWTIEHV